MRTLKQAYNPYRQIATVEDVDTVTVELDSEDDEITLRENALLAYSFSGGRDSTEVVALVRDAAEIEPENDSFACIALDLSFSDIEPAYTYDDVQEVFEVEDEELVQKFLSKHKELSTFLLKARTALCGVFGTERMYLEAQADPYRRDEIELTIMVSVEELPESALRKLHKFDREWWKENRHLSEDRISVDLCYE